MEKQLRDEKPQAHSINTVKTLPQNNNNNNKALVCIPHTVGMLPDLSDLCGGCLPTQSRLSFKTHISNSTGKVSSI